MQGLYNGIGLSVLNVRHRESFPVINSLGGICESLAQQIFPHLQYPSCETS